VKDRGTKAAPAVTIEMVPASSPAAALARRREEIDSLATLSEQRAQQL
jgi:hypothetical protein